MAAATLTLLLTGCTVLQSDPPPPTSATSAPAPTTSASPEPAWKITNFDQRDGGRFPSVAVSGDTVIVARYESLEGYDRATGSLRWHHPKNTVNKSHTFEVSGDLIVLSDFTDTNGQRPFEVIEASTGKALWSGAPRSFTLHGSAIYQVSCAQSDKQCRTMRYDLRTGEPTWPAPIAAAVVHDPIGITKGHTLPEPAYLAAYLMAEDEWRMVLVEAATGTILPGRAHDDGWLNMSVDDTLVTTDSGRAGSKPDEDCPVSITFTDARTGTQLHQSTVYSGRYQDRTCRKLLMTYPDRVAGIGTRAVVVTADGAPQLFDLATRDTVWTAPVRGVPIDGDDRSVLVREFPGSGPMSLLDLTTGTVRWTIDSAPVTNTMDAYTVVTTDRIILAGKDAVIVLDRADGHEITRYPAMRLLGAGDGWTAVYSFDNGKRSMQIFD